MKPSFSPKRWIFQAFLLSVSLFAVVSVIQNLRDPVRNPLRHLFPPGVQQPQFDGSLWNWCPPGAEALEAAVAFEWLPGPEAISGALDQRLCLVKTEAMAVEEVEGTEWTPLIRVIFQGQSSELEGDLDRGIFRAKGLPFGSAELQQRLKALSSP